MTEVRSVAFTVSDLDRSIDFYTRILPFYKIGETEVSGETYERLTGVFGMRTRLALLRLGDESIVLVEFLAPRGRQVPADSRSNDGWYQQVTLVVNNMDKAYDWLHNRRVAFISPNPQRLPESNARLGGVCAFRFMDPDGHPLEIVQFPDGKGDPKWHRENRGEKLFLGIDHASLVVTATDKSLYLYRDLLGMQVKEESVMEGPEQERLSNVFGARVKVTKLSALSGPGIELIEYLAPAPCTEGQSPQRPLKLGDPAPCGRAYPVGTWPNDMVYGQINMITSDANDDVVELKKAGIPLVSSGTITLSEDKQRSVRGFLMRDLDGHALLIKEK